MSIIEKAAKRLAEKRRVTQREDRGGVPGPGGTTGADGQWPEELETSGAGIAREPDLPAPTGWSHPEDEAPGTGSTGFAADGSGVDHGEGPEPATHASAIERMQASEEATRSWAPFEEQPPTLAEATEDGAQGWASFETEAPESGWAQGEDGQPDYFEPDSAGGLDTGFLDETDVDALIRITALDPETILMPDGGRTRMAEEFRVIKRPLLMKAFGGAAKTRRHSNLIMMSSSIQSEGKSFTSLNLAISIAMEMDSTVLLVDADVAKPGLSRRLDVQQRPGLIERLIDDQADLSQFLIRTDIPKLTVLPAGERHKRSTELLASQKMADLLDELSSRYSDRIVLFDSPPLLESTEAAVLASQMGQVVVVVESEGTSRMLVKEALSLLDSLENVSFVLNKVRESAVTNRLKGYGYSYGYGYYGESEGK